ncbi:hypothetical protein ACQEVG_18765 [Streptomyces sp. CA-135486]|uniref:hypothetical protein n=1 Tax=Streptomyces sp. CA-135486 TaxID=3240049 RepID=UPI003D937141
MSTRSVTRLRCQCGGATSAAKRRAVKSAGSLNAIDGSPSWTARRQASSIDV